VRRVKQQARERGDALPRFHLRGSKGKFTPACQVKLREWITLKPDQTLAELRQRLENDLHVKVSTSTVDRWTKKLRLTFKKSLSTPLSRTAPTSRRNASDGTTT
jgi:transposase